MSAAARLSEGIVPLFTLRVADVTANDQRLIEEDVFGFFWSDLMLLPILLNVGFIPIESGALIQRALAFRHNHEYTMDVYRRAFAR